MSLKNLYLKDVKTQEITQHENIKEVHQYIISITNIDFDINLIYKNKHRATKICRRFLISENAEFKSKAKTRELTEQELEKNIKKLQNSRIEKSWFNKKTRFIKK